MTPKKYQYQVRPGMKFGAYRQYGPGAIVELTEDEADDFRDVLELVRGKPEPVSNESQIAHLSTLTIGQLKELPEYQEMEAPRPRSKENILHAILVTRGLE